MLSGLSQYFNFGNNFQRGINTLTNTVNEVLDEVSEVVGDYSLDLFNFARKCFKTCIKNSSLNIALNSFQKQRALEEIKNAKTRNNAKSNNDIKDYHQSIQFNPKTKQGIFLSHKASGDKPRKLVILLMGNLQDPGMSQEKAGILKIYEQLKKEDKHDLLLCRVGDANADLKHKFCLSNDASLNTKVVYEHISNLIEDKVNSRGQFSKEQKPKSIDFVGFSWGAGVQKKLEKRWQNITGFDSARTVAIDAIKYGCDNCGEEICRRPKYSSEHLNISQKNEYLLNGGCLKNKSDEDTFIDANDIDSSKPKHSEIDDSKAVITRVLNFIDN